ncbi:hypothetical protein MML48_3g00016412 [Holotrichia oblita]|uniref:Uncharacterized protein n=1 Tax=Holotrichia oblita TaxID=644536 RepID=A0ACB9TH11_HOLOL|nr:hypothetical protein MML48_3g00016412 [Holotrichia oblita]
MLSSLSMNRENQMAAAVDAVKNGMSKQFGVPRSTIQFRMGDKFKKPSTYLSKQEEAVVVGSRVRNLLQICVQHFITTTKRNTPFRDNLPDKGWYKAFIKRLPELTLRTSEAVTRASGCISENDIKNWFTTIENGLDNDGLKDILKDGDRVFNGDETNFLLCPKNRKVIACRGSVNVYEVDQGTAKSSITVMFTFGANGSITPLMITYPYKRKPPPEIVETVSDRKWGIGYSDNGWMKSSLFYEYIGNVFNWV